MRRDATTASRAAAGPAPQGRRRWPATAAPTPPRRTSPCRKARAFPHGPHSSGGGRACTTRRRADSNRRLSPCMREHRAAGQPGSELAGRPGTASGRREGARRGPGWHHGCKTAISGLVLRHLNGRRRVRPAVCGKVRAPGRPQRATARGSCHRAPHPRVHQGLQDVAQERAELRTTTVSWPRVKLSSLNGPVPMASVMP